jgi:hypothetical protein
MVLNDDMSTNPDTRPATIEARNVTRCDIITHPHTGEHVTVTHRHPADDLGLVPVRYCAVRADGATTWATFHIEPGALLYHHGYDGTPSPEPVDA